MPVYTVLKCGIGWQLVCICEDRPLACKVRDKLKAKFPGEEFKVESDTVFTDLDSALFALELDE